MKELCLEFCNMTDDIFDRLRFNNWKNIRLISIGNNIYIIGNNLLSDESVRLLCSFDWPLMETVVLEQNKITAKGINYLSKSKWPNLTDLLLCIIQIK